MTRIVVPAAATLLIVVSLIAVDGWNRSGEPLQRITLTERELPVSWTGVAEERDVRLRIEPQGYTPLEQRNWLTEERLRALGFVFDVMPGAPEAADTYHRMLPKVAWVAFEYDGDAWRAIERRRELIEQYRTHNVSHLVPVDASLDRDTLLARYPLQHLVLRAVIRVSYLGPSERGPLVYGYVSHVIPDHITVPLRLRSPLMALSERNEQLSPRYEVDLAVGRLGLPYISEIRVIPKP